jgi:hypothetical protein
MKTGTIIDGFKIVEAFGTPELLEKMFNEAKGYIGVTGSVGVVMIECGNDKFGNIIEIGKMDVERVRA